MPKYKYTSKIKISESGKAQAKLPTRESLVVEYSRNEAWRRGKISELLLDCNQKTMYEQFISSKEMKSVWVCSRRIGKTWLLCVIAIQTCIKKPNSQVKYITSLSKSAREIVLPLIREITKKAPKEVKPKFNKMESSFSFPNGSQILLHGAEKDPEAIRGAAADLAIVDEAGFINDLEYLVSDIINPMVIERNGRLLLSSTTPKNPEHPFVTKYMAEAQIKNTLIQRDIYSCPRFTENQLKTFIDEAGGKESETFRREYLNEIIRDIKTAVVPEFSRIRHVINDIQPSKYRTYYVGLDVGFSDNTAIIFGYYDFERAKAVIQGESILQKAITRDIANEIQAAEKVFFPGGAEIKRFSDIDLRLISELRIDYGIKFKATEKQNKELIINKLRLLCAEDQIEIHSSCKNLITQLENGIWKVNKSTGARTFGRSEGLGHLDAIDALLYLIRNIDLSKLPPKEDEPKTWFDVWGEDKNKKNNNVIQLRRAFNRN